MNDVQDAGFRWMNYCTALVLVEFVAVSGLSGEFREARNAGIFRVWCLSIDIHFIMLHVEFEVGLSILVMEKQGNSSQKLIIEKYLKKVKPPTHYLVRAYCNQTPFHQHHIL